MLKSKLLWGPLKCLINSCKFSKLTGQKQQLNLPLPSDMTFLCTEHKCFNKCAFCLNMATHNRQANGFSPVWTRKWVFKFHDIPNCLPQYSHLYSRSCCILDTLPPPTGDEELVPFESWVSFGLFVWSGPSFLESIPRLLLDRPLSKRPGKNKRKLINGMRETSREFFHLLS